MIIAGCFGMEEYELAELNIEVCCSHFPKYQWANTSSQIDRRCNLSNIAGKARHVRE